MKKTDKYKAQALAIAMVVLVIASIIGVAIYSRSSQSTEETIDERASSEALELSDSFLTKLTEFSIQSIEQKIVEIQNAGNSTEDQQDIEWKNGIEYKENTESAKKEITTFLKSLGVENFFDEQSLANSGCSLDIAGNQYVLSVKEADLTSAYEVRSGQTWSLPIENHDFGANGCTLYLYPRSVDSDSGFMITKTYTRYNASGELIEYKDYDYADVENYCMSGDNATCNNKNFSENNTWKLYNTNTNEPLVINLLETKTSNSQVYKLESVTLRSINGTVGVSYSMTDNTGKSCSENFRLMQIRFGAYCSGNYRGKEVLMPEKQWSSSLFDYVIFNGEGTLGSSN